MFLLQKLGVLHKTTQDISSRLEECEKVVQTWGPVPQDTNMADQYIHNVRVSCENTVIEFASIPIEKTKQGLFKFSNIEPLWLGFDLNGFNKLLSSTFSESAFL